MKKVVLFQQWKLNLRLFQFSTKFFLLFYNKPLIFATLCCSLCHRASLNGRGPSHFLLTKNQSFVEKHRMVFYIKMQTYTTEKALIMNITQINTHKLIVMTLAKGCELSVQI